MIVVMKPIVIKDGITDFGKIWIKTSLLTMSVPWVHAASLLWMDTNVFCCQNLVSSSAIPGLPLAPDAQNQNTWFQLECLKWILKFHFKMPYMNLGKIWRLIQLCHCWVLWQGMTSAVKCLKSSVSVHLHVFASLKKHGVPLWLCGMK